MSAQRSAATLDVVMTRTLPAPPEQVWRAWTEPALVCEWWGPTGFTCVRSDLDVRVDGTSLLTMQAPEEYGGSRFHTSWSYSVVAEPSRLEFVLRFLDEDDHVVDPATTGIGPGVPAEVPHVIELHGSDAGGTVLTVTERGYTTEEAVAQSSAGLDQSLAEMTALFQP